MPKFLRALVLSLLLPLLMSAQAVYSGRVQDVANGRPISGVEVALLHSPVVQTSNLFGDFILKNTEQDSLVPSQPYQCA